MSASAEMQSCWLDKELLTLNNPTATASDAMRAPWWDAIQYVTLVFTYNLTRCLHLTGDAPEMQMERAGQ